MSKGNDEFKAELKMSMGGKFFASQIVTPAVSAVVGAVIAKMLG